jgi:hypothetical protein
VGAAFIIAGIVVCLAIQRLRIPEILELQRVFDRGLYQRRVIAHNTRLRESIMLLQTVEEAPDLERALRHAFEQGEFDVVELSMRGDPAPPLNLQVVRNGASNGHGNGPGVIDISREARQKHAVVPSGWEISLPFRNPAGEVVGALTLWSNAEKGHILTDLSLIARGLQPALREAYARVSGTRDVPIEAQPMVLRTAVAP